MPTLVVSLVVIARLHVITFRDLIMSLQTIYGYEKEELTIGCE